MFGVFLSVCDLEEIVYNIHELANFNCYTIGNSLYFPQAWQNIDASIHGFVIRKAVVGRAAKRYSHNLFS